MVMKRMSDVTMEPGFNLVIAMFNETKMVKNSSIRTGSAYCFRIAAALQRLNFEYTFAALPATTGVDFNYLGATSHGVGDDILRVPDTEPFVINQFFPVPTVAGMRMYSRFTSSGSNMSPFVYENQGKPAPTAGDRGWLAQANDLLLTKGQDDDIRDPPAFLQHFGWYVGEEHAFEVGLYNPTAAPITPALSVKGSAYRLDPVVDPDMQKKMILGKVPRVLYQVEGLSKPIDGYIPKEWEQVGAKAKWDWPASESI